MDHVVVVDHLLFAEGFSLLLKQHHADNVLVTTAERVDHAPLAALVLIELFLPDQQCGLQLARHLQQVRPDLKLVIWTIEPMPIYVWAALEYKVAGCLDKRMPVPELLYWCGHAMTTGAAWPGDLLSQAREWSQEAAYRLRSMTHDLWHLWAGLLREESINELADQLGWSKRTAERRLTALYSLLGVQCRSEAVNIAWKWSLVQTRSAEIDWFTVAPDLLLLPGSEKRGGHLLGARMVGQEHADWTGYSQ